MSEFASLAMIRVFERVYRAICFCGDPVSFYTTVVGCVKIYQSSSNRTMGKQRRNAPLFNSEHLLSKAIPQLIGGGINLCVQLSV